MPDDQANPPPARARAMEPELDMTAQGIKPRWNPEINFGHVGQMIVILLVAAVYYANVNTGLEESKKAREKYIPIIEKAEDDNKLQDERISVIIKLTSDQQQINREVNGVLRDLSTDIALIKSKLGVTDQSRDRYRPSP